MSLRLSDVTALIVDTKHKTPKYTDNGHPCIRTPNLGRGFFILDGVRRVSNETYKEWTERAVPSYGDLILAREAPVGNVALVPRGLEPCIGQRTVLIRPIADIVDARYLTYLLLGDAMQHKMHSVASGATVPHLNMSDIRSLELPSLPTISVQRRIASILSAYDDLIENNRRRIEILEEMAQNLYREWFVNFRFPGHENVRIVDSELGKVPEGWEVKHLGDIAGLNELSIKPKSAPAHIHYVSIKAVSTGSIDSLVSIVFSDAPGRARRIVRNGDIIWSTVRPNLQAYALVLDPPQDMIASTGFAVISPKECPFSFVYCAVTTHEFVGYLVNHAKGSAYPAVSVDDFKSAPTVVPPSHLLDQFHRIAGSAFKLSANLAIRNAVLRQTRDLLLPKLISGELDISELDIEISEEAA